jgi:hypothetical protein
MHVAAFRELYPRDRRFERRFHPRDVSVPRKPQRYPGYWAMLTSLTEEAEGMACIHIEKGEGQGAVIIYRVPEDVANI